jgi:hypothetical protein
MFLDNGKNVATRVEAIHDYVAWMRATKRSFIRGFRVGAGAGGPF